MWEAKLNNRGQIVESRIWGDLDVARFEIPGIRARLPDLIEAVS